MRFRYVALLLSWWHTVFTLMPFGVSMMERSRFDKPPALTAFVDKRFRPVSFRIPYLAQIIFAFSKLPREPALCAHALEPLDRPIQNTWHLVVYNLLLEPILFPDALGGDVLCEPDKHKPPEEPV